jgi:signal transduction histidine kinase
MKFPGWIFSNIPPSAKRDAILLPVLFVVNCDIYSAWRHLDQIATRPWLLLIWLYGLVGLVPLVWRDRAPVTVFAVQWVLTMAAWPIMTQYSPVVGIPVALYAVAVHCSGRISLLALLASFVSNGLVAAAAFMDHPTLATKVSSFLANGIFLVLVACGTWVLGRVTQASQRHVRCLENERQTALEAVVAERRRIARELHDIISHAVTVIVLQAAGAARVAGTNFPQVIESLGHIQTMGEQAMAELGRLLGVLQAGDVASPAVGLGELGPQPGLADLSMLLGSLRATGMPVTVDVEGTPRDLDPSVDLSAYRIVQEGLTNVLKHAGKNANPRLRLAWEAQRLLIQIDNDTSPGQTHRGQRLSNGRGLLGLQERVHAAGGQLHAGPAPHQGRYRLAATLPLTATAHRHGTKATRSTSLQN